MKSLDSLIRDHLPMTLRFAQRLTGNLNDAEELVQESLLKVARSWLSYRREATFRTWLFRIVINTFRDQQRKRPAPEPLPASVVDHRVTGVENQLGFAEFSAELTARVERLPARQREVFVLTVYEELSASEVARVLGISTANVYSQLRLARQALRPWVENR